MEETEWILCPLCKYKTRVKIRADTELKNFPLFCPKCKTESLIAVQRFQIKMIESSEQTTQKNK